MNTLYIDTHHSKYFEIGYDNGKLFKIISGEDASLEILEKIELLTKNNIDKIIICTGPGSLTGLRIGSCFAQGIALAKNIQTYGINIWDLLFSEHQNIEIYFHTGTKKWIHKTKNQESFLEILPSPVQNWTSNKVEFLSNFNQKTYKKWPKIINLMQKYNKKASKNIDLLYPIDLFSSKI